MYDKSIKEFGAVGDGITDDTEALKRALAYDGTVFFPSGVYVLKECLYTENSVRWVGTGDSSVIQIRPEDTSKCDYHKDTRKEDRWVYDFRLLFMRNGKHLEIRHMKLDANKEAFARSEIGFSEYDFTTCLDVWGAERIILDDVTIRGGLIEGAYIEKTANIRITKCRFIENGLDNYDAAGLQILGNHNDTPEILISDSTFSNNGFNGLELNRVYGAVVNNITCSHNGCEGVAFWNGCSHCLLSNVFAEDNRAGINFRRNYSAGVLDVMQKNTDSFTTDIIVSNLVTISNKYGILWGCAQNIFINGWCGIADNYNHALVFLKPDEDITAEIRSAHLLPKSGDICNPDNESDITKFKLKSI